MQKMTNVLLANNKAESKPSTESKQVTQSDGKTTKDSDFSTALQQASVEAKQQVKSASKETSNSESKQTRAQDPELQAKAEGSIVAEEAAEQDGDLIDVSHVLAQINLASELSKSTLESESKISGDSLPLDEMLIDEQSIETLMAKIDGETEQDLDIVDAETLEPLDEKLLAELQRQSGLTKEELQALSPEVLNQLVVLVNSGGDYQAMLDAIESDKILPDDVAITGQEAELSDAELPHNMQALAGITAEKEMKKGQGSPSNSETKPLTGEQLRQVETAKEGHLVKGEEPKVNQLQGQELASKPKFDNDKFSNILGEKTLAQSEAASKANKTDGQVIAEQQLKGAELTVKLQPVKAGVEQSIVLSESLQGGESKLQQTSSLLSPQPQRTDIAQIQVSLRQSNEQQVQLQDMIQRFAPVMKQQLVTMVSQGVQHAEIRLDPPELGQLMVRIQVQGDQTQVQFQVAQHQTRDLIEQAIPRLKDLLSEQGMQLTDSHVSQENSNNGEGEQASEDNGDQFTSELDEISAEESLISSKQATSYRSGIDYYA
ncbi:flagellar hook-length control protein FliK [Shewanella nanhaiensis]|uniref:Flagellar hook-length control protein FliK n=1 Tax=Shewanella nanhaiensis TaxID=2864872 RepID=A0ABS7E652_9GAMM|nr:flagellar hook-length control protein FliK [Shewanella nanhaiensis]MBW8185166.1 flagellar hook-length control protein FliK [Shewanella nanhaiensis]